MWGRTPCSKDGNWVGALGLEDSSEADGTLNPEVEGSGPFLCARNQDFSGGDVLPSWCGSVLHFSYS